MEHLWRIDTCLDSRIALRLDSNFRMRIELNTKHDFSAVDFYTGTICAVCGQPIQTPPALWLGVDGMDFYLHRHCEGSFNSDTVKRHIGDMVLVMQDQSFHDIPPERNRLDRGR
jgi:hypothetical protein